MTSRRAVIAVLALLFLLRHDFWWWEASQRWFGIPIGLAWHLLICFGVAIGMALFAKIDEDDRSEPS